MECAGTLNYKRIQNVGVGGAMRAKDRVGK